MRASIPYTSPTQGGTNMRHARLAWRGSIPAWVEGLAIACDAAVSTAMAAELATSTGIIGAVLKRQYRGNLKSLEASFEAWLRTKA